MNPEVLVIGAGPTGLTLASELRRHGATCRIVDQLDEPVTWSKAAVVHARTMEVFASMGVVDAMLAQAKAIHGVNLYVGERRVLHNAFDGIDSPYPHLYGISQHDTEAVLNEHAKKLGATPERGVRLDSFRADDEGVTAELVHTSGATETVRARYLVGCDGAHSRVRDVLGIPFEGASYEERLIQADVHLAWPWRLENDEICTFLHPDGPLACFPLFKDGRYRLIAVLPPHAETEPTLENFQRLLDERTVPGAKVSDPAWMVGFRIHCRMVPRYREGRVLLAGDAAHIQSPLGGQGMNTGIQDAHNLGWKLALAARGKARPVVLDSYDAERRPVARATLDATDAATRGGAKIIGLRHPIAIEVRNQLIGFVGSLGVVRERVVSSLSMLDTHYKKSPIVGQDQVSAWASTGFGSSPEGPSLFDWAQFGAAPGPGDRTSDVELPGETEGRTRLFDFLRGTKHTLFLLDGASASVEGYANFDTIAHRIRARFADHVDIQVVLPLSRRPDALAETSIIHDTDGALHRHFGARSECLYLIRPDGFVAYRCQPADGKKLEGYLERVFVGDGSSQG